jgi:hypothetical protein
LSAPTMGPLAAVVLAATLSGLPANAGATPSEEPLAPAPTWQLRAQVRPGPGISLTEPRRLSDALARVREATCREARDLLADGEPRTTRVELTLWRQQGTDDGSTAPSKAVDCHLRQTRISAFTVRSRVRSTDGSGRSTGTGTMSLGAAVHRVTELANTIGVRVLQTGEQAWITLRVSRREKAPRGMVRGLARRHGVSVTTALRVAACESGFNPRAYSPAGPYVGIYQQDADLWPARARRYGHPGASPFDPYANIDVSLRMARAVGWGHWGCA